MPSKKEELCNLITSDKPMIVAVSEVKPKNAREREALDYSIPVFSMYSVNIKPSEPGRGIVVFAHDSIEKSVIEIKPEIKFVLLEVRLRGNDNLLFGCFYRSPTTSVISESNNECLNQLLQSLWKKKYSHICFVGDFNFRDINWATNTSPHDEESIEMNIIDTVQDCFLHQHITKPTRKRGNDEASLLDLVLTNEELQVSGIGFHAPLVK